ncbi:MAG TPA: hypothetical protein VHK06_05635, partial [Candidatus Limnocylindria bacterium]|nr:hypothetical protein [Candidatus Limnocylindria bacterium]
AVLDAVAPASPQRRRPIAQLIRAEALAAAGDVAGAQGLAEAVVSALGADGAWRLRGGMASRLTWPVPPVLRPAPGRPSAPGAFASPMAEPADASEGRPDAPPRGDRVAAARARLEAARHAYSGGDAVRGDRELSVGVRLDPAIAAEGVALMEPTLGDQPGGERLLLYGDLLRAAGRPADADATYDRAAGA